jgi:hypothetical protein
MGRSGSCGSGEAELAFSIAVNTECSSATALPPPYGVSNVAFVGSFALISGRAHRTHRTETYSRMTLPPLRIAAAAFYRICAQQNSMTHSISWIDFCGRNVWGRGAKT